MFFSYSPFYFEFLARLLGASLKKVYPSLPLFGGSLNDTYFYFDCKAEFFTPHPDLHPLLKENMLRLWKKRGEFTLSSMMQQNAIQFLKSKKQEELAAVVEFSEENVVQLLEIEGLYFLFPSVYSEKDLQGLLEENAFPSLEFCDPLFFEREEVLYFRLQGKVKEKKEKKKGFPFFQKESETALVLKGVWNSLASHFFYHLEDLQEKMIKKGFEGPFFGRNSFSIPFEEEKKESLFLEEALIFYDMVKNEKKESYKKEVAPKSWIYRDYIRFFTSVSSPSSWEEMQRETYPTPLFEVGHAELNAFFYKGEAFSEGFIAFLQAAKTLAEVLGGELLYSLSETGKKRWEKKEMEALLNKEEISPLLEVPVQSEGVFVGSSLKVALWIKAKGFKESFLKMLSTFEIITNTKIFKGNIPYEVALFSLMGSKERFLSLVWEMQKEIPSFFHPTPLQFILIGKTGKMEEELFSLLFSYKIPYTLSFGEGKVGDSIALLAGKEIPYIAVIGDKEREKRSVSFRDKNGVQTLPYSDFALLMRNKLTFIGEESLESQ